MPIKSDVITQAFRRLNVGGVGDPIHGEEYSEAAAVLDGLFAELQASQGFTFAYTLDGTIPQAQLMPLAWLLAVDIAPAWEKTAPDSRERAIFRLRAVAHPYVRDMDLNDDGETTEAEECAFDRGAYF